MPDPQTVLIVGGGIAGMSAAIRLAQAGVAVTLLETRKKLGGRATSFLDSRSGLVLDNCQHVVLGCCTNYVDLLGRLGAADKIRWHAEQYWIEAGGRTSVIRPTLLPAPLHMGWSMLRAPFLSVSDAAMIARAVGQILRADRSRHRHETFGRFLARHGQSKRIIDRFWSPIVVSACNLGVERVAASAALHVFQEGFLSSSRAAAIGVPAVPLVRLYENAEAIISGAGGRVVFGAGVACLDASSASTTAGERFEAKRVICAVPVERVNRIVDPAIQQSDPRFPPLENFTHSPILGVHLRFDRPVLRTPHAILVDRPTQWLFAKGLPRDNGRPVAPGAGGGDYLHAVISAAADWLALDEDQIAERVLADIHACLPDARDATLVSARAVKEKLATFAPVPGIDECRPAATGPSGLILAGDYTDIGWPATMEGATRSGYAAAAAALGVPATDLLAPPLAVAPLSRALGLRSPAVTPDPAPRAAGS